MRDVYAWYTPMERVRELEEAMLPFAVLGKCISDVRSPDRKFHKDGTIKDNDSTIWVGQVLRGKTREEDFHAPVTNGDMRRAARIMGLME